MSKKNSPAAKAARRLEREAAKQKSSERTYSEPSQDESAIIKQNAAEKLSFGNFTQEELLKIPVRITFFSDKLIKNNAILEFETDMDRFLNTLLFCKSKIREDEYISYEYYSNLMDLIKCNAPFNEYMFTIGMHYLACQPCVEHKLRYGLQPVSFRVMLNGDENKIDTLVQMGSLEEWFAVRDQCFDSLLNNKNQHDPFLNVNQLSTAKPEFNSEELPISYNKIGIICEMVYKKGFTTFKGFETQFTAFEEVVNNHRQQPMSQDQISSATGKLCEYHLYGLPVDEDFAEAMLLYLASRKISEDALKFQKNKTFGFLISLNHGTGNITLKTIDYNSWSELKLEVEKRSNRKFINK